MPFSSLNKLFLTTTSKTIRRCFNTDLAEPHIKFRETCRQFAECNLKPIAAKLDREGKFPTEQVKYLKPLLILFRDHF